jgi:hypothetical protein
MEADPLKEACLVDVLGTPFADPTLGDFVALSSPLGLGLRLAVPQDRQPLSQRKLVAYHSHETEHKAASLKVRVADHSHFDPWISNLADLSSPLWWT